MNRQKWTMLIVAVALMAGTGTLLARYRIFQKLGAPGVKTSPIADSIRLRVELPEKVLDYESEWVEADKITMDTLPKDTSFGQRIYKAPDGFSVQMGVVLMGADRTSLHKPQFCLRGSGMNVSLAEQKSVAVDRPVPYELAVSRMIAVPEKGDARVRGVYVYWFVADEALTPHHEQRMWWMAKNLVLTGVLQRWAYVYCFATCELGQEEAAFERVKKLIAAAVPEFQLVPRPTPTAALPAP